METDIDFVGPVQDFVGPLPAWNAGLYPLTKFWDQAEYDSLFAQFNGPPIVWPTPAPTIVATIEYMSALDDTIAAGNMPKNFSVNAISNMSDAVRSYMRWDDYREYYATPELYDSIMPYIESLNINFQEQITEHLATLTFSPFVFVI